MRRLTRTLLTSALVLTSTAACAQAAPKISFTARATPVTGFTASGNVVGAGASLELRLGISDTEHGAFPPPLEHLAVRLPAGMRWDASAFPHCSYSPLEPRSPGPAGPKCPPHSRAGAVTAGQFAVSSGQTVAPDPASIETFYDQGGGFYIFVLAHDRALAFLSHGVFTRPAPAGQVLAFDLPSLVTVPNAWSASVTSFTLRIGTGAKRAGRAFFSLRMPRTCPRGALSFKVEARFGGATPQTASARSRAPCPRARRTHP
ncbi:MAG: hypothetical protein QOK19_144 [Solirubrobacteraceae bacterium]|jgi:hypothetical protein|nr:hypothetical protein [Solirubrobacteraceae bacterium]